MDSKEAAGDLRGSIMQTWGFEHIGGGKRYVRRVSLVGSTGEAVQARLVYDYGEFSIPSHDIRRFRMSLTRIAEGTL